jgi:tRNA-Thr(GGU) m(6)t(6)A37 methyltransferase TsaA
MELRTIGTVHSGAKDSKGVPRLGAAARVVLLPEFASGLLRVEKHSHLWVFAWLDQAERNLLQLVPRDVEDRGPESLHGVFGIRSPARPNPIGLTAARVLGVEGVTIEFDRLDFKDGTPVIDLKPYFVSRDMIFSATNEQLGRPPEKAALRGSLLMQAARFHGSTSPEIELAVDIFADFRADVLQMVEPRKLKVTVPIERPGIVDAFMGMTRTRLGLGTLMLGGFEVVRLESEAALGEYALSASGYVRITPPPVHEDSRDK